ncbi:MAG: O-antigen ligase family protein [Anaerolineae bacterium]|nr:O-antigen ligase family protein [Anaerolineae bacterium]
MTVTTYLIIWVTYALLLRICYYFVLGLPVKLVTEMTIGTGVVGCVVGLLILLRPWLSFRRQTSNSTVTFHANRIFSAIVMIVVIYTITLTAINELPPAVAISPWVGHLNIALFYRLIYYLLLIYVLLTALEIFGRFPLAETGLTLIVSYGVLNGGFFNIFETTKVSLFYGLTLITFLVHLIEPRPSAPKNYLALPIVIFALIGAVATWQAFYVYASFVRWVALLNWMVVYYLLVTVIGSLQQVKRLMVALLMMAGLVAIAALSTLPPTAWQVGWTRALSLRLHIGQAYSNPLGIYTAMYIVLSLGSLSIWSKRHQRMGLILLSLLLFTVLVLTYSRSTAVALGMGLIGLFIASTYRRIPADSRLLLMKKSVNNQKRVVVTLILVLLVTGILVAFGFLNRNSSALRSISHLAGRLYLWQVTVNSISSAPVIGLGLDNNLNPLFYDVLSSKELKSVHHFITTTHTHNLFLEVGNATGLIGLVAFIWLLGAATLYSWRAVTNQQLGTVQRWLLTVFCMIGVVLMVPHMLIMALSTQSLIAGSFWLLLALFVITGRAQLETTAPPHASQFISPRHSMFFAGLTFLAAVVVVGRPVAADNFYQQAKRALTTDNQAEITQAVAWALWLDPLNAQIRSDLAQGMIKWDGPAAIRLYQQAITLRPYYAPYHNALGWLYWRENQLPAAITAFEQAVALDRYELTGPPYHIHLAYAYAAAGRKQRVIKTLRASPNLSLASIKEPDWRLEGQNVALAYAPSNDVGYQDPYIRSLIDMHLGLLDAVPDTAVSTTQPHIYLSELMPKLIAIESATDSELSAMPAANLIKRANNFARLGRHALAIRLLAFTRNLPPPHTPAEARQYIQRGNTYHRLGETVQAQADLETARQFVKTASLHRSLGLLYQAQGKLPEAAAEFEAMAAFWEMEAPLPEQWWLEAGHAFQQAGHLDQAIEAYKMAQFAGNFPDRYIRTQLMINQIYLEQNSPTNVLSSGQRIVRLLAESQPDIDTVRPLLSNLAAQTGQAYDRLGIEIDAALQNQPRSLDPNNPVVRAYLHLLVEKMTTTSTSLYPSSSQP